MINSILIARSSKDLHDVSCESQIFEMRKEAHRLGEHVYKTYKFSQISHSEFREHPQFNEILSEIKSKTRKWSKIWFYDTARVSRMRLYAGQFKAFLKRYGVEVQFLNMPKTGIDSIDRAMEGILETFDQMHSDISRAGAIRGQKENIREGYRAGGSAPYGYRLKNNPKGYDKAGKEKFKTTLEPDPITFPIAKEYLERRGNGESRRSILMDFTKRGIKPPRGGNLWHSSSGKSIEENLLVYQGNLVYNRHNERIFKKGYVGGTKWRDRSQWEIKQNAHERCISDEIANKIGLQLDKNKSRKTNPGPKKYLLTDILFCSSCNNRMVGNSGFYACQTKNKNKNLCNNNNIKTEFLDKNILKYLKDNLIQKKFYDKYVEAIKNQLEKYKKEASAENKQQSKRLAEIDSQIAKLMTLFSKGRIKDEIIESQIEPLQKEKEELEIRSAEFSMGNAIIDAKVSEYSSESIKEQLERFEEMLNENNVIEMRAMVRDFIKKIVLYPKENPVEKKWKRRIHIESYVRALTMIIVASPTGFEPVLPT